MDIILELSADHAAIRAILTELRSESTAPSQQKEKLQKLGAWLKAHGDGEDRTIDALAKQQGGALRVLGIEDGGEHEVINRLYAKLQRSSNQALWHARLNLLCELISQHLNEEEREFFPFLQRSLSAQQAEKLGSRYRELTRGIDRLRPEVASNVLGWITGRPDPQAAETNLH